MKPIGEWNWTFVGVVLGVAVFLIGVYQMVESSEAQLRAEMQRLNAEMYRIEANLKAEMQRIEVERKAEMQRIEAERKADEAERKAEMADLRAELAALSSKLDSFIERVDARLNEVEKEQARLNAVNDLLAQQIPTLNDQRSPPYGGRVRAMLEFH